MPFAWDPAKRAQNLAKHGVDFLDVEYFDWATAVVRADVRSNYGEVRLVATGLIRKRLHVLVFTIRRSVWIISVRRANNKEIDRYEDEA